MALENLLGSVKNLLGSTVSKIGATALLGAGLLFGGGCGQEEDIIEPKSGYSLSATAGEREATLFWTNPDDDTFKGAMLRRKTGSFPIDTNDGILLYEGSTLESISDTGLEPSVEHFYKIFFFMSQDPTLEMTASATPYDTTPPPNISNLGWEQSNIYIKLLWNNNLVFDSAGVIVRRKQGAFPVDQDDGDFVYQGPGQQVVDGIATGDGQYYYAAFAYDHSGNHSSGETLFIDFDNVYFLRWLGGGSNFWKTGNGANWANDYQSFQHPYDVSVDANGFIYVLDSGNARVDKWTSTASAQGWIGVGQDGWQTWSGATQGSDYKSFLVAQGMFIASNGDIYVADTYNNRVSKWDSSGNVQGWIGGDSNGWKTVTGTSSGTSQQSFSLPRDVAVDANGNIYVADFQNHRVCKWNSAGNSLGWIGNGQNGWQTGSAPTSGCVGYHSFLYPSGLIIDDENGHIYIADYSCNRVSKWSLDGTAIGCIGEGQDRWRTDPISNAGSDYRSFSQPHNIAIANGFLYIADRMNHRICKWNLDGTAVGWMGGEHNGWQKSDGTSFSSDEKGFYQPQGVFVDNNGFIYVTDSKNHRISKWQD
ncbi:MAG: hypothetical protein KAT43_02650 [Nanoarchaeota archaeon]|nr:hypothetical protein [Nanoarchaeota archaeon]